MDTRSPELRAAIDRFGGVRDSPDDLAWAEQAAARLLRDEPDPDAVVRALDEAAHGVAGSAESPAELLGTPEEWARSERGRREQDGAPLLARPERMSLRDAVGTALISTAWFSILLGMFFLVTATWRVQPSALALPAALGAGIAALILVYRRVIRRLPFVPTVLVCAVALLVFSSAAGWTIVELRESSADLVSLAWFVPVIAGSGVAAIAWVLWVPQPTPAPGTHSGPAGSPESAEQPPRSDDDERWLRHFGAALRERGDTSDARVREIVAEARSHGVESGSPLIEEFGPADAAARRYATGGGVRARRFTLLWAVLAIFPVVQIIRSVMDRGWTLSWDLVLPVLWLAAVLLCLAQAVREWRRAVLSRRAQDGYSSSR